MSSHIFIFVSSVFFVVRPGKRGAGFFCFVFDRKKIVVFCPELIEAGGGELSQKVGRRQKRR